MKVQSFEQIVHRALRPANMNDEMKIVLAPFKGLYNINFRTSRQYGNTFSIDPITREINVRTKGIVKLLDLVIIEQAYKTFPREITSAASFNALANIPDWFDYLTTKLDKDSFTSRLLTVILAVNDIIQISAALSVFYEHPAKESVAIIKDWITMAKQFNNPNYTAMEISDDIQEFFDTTRLVPYNQAFNIMRIIIAHGWEIIMTILTDMKDKPVDDLVQYTNSVFCSLLTPDGISVLSDDKMPTAAELITLILQNSKATQLGKFSFQYLYKWTPQGLNVFYPNGHAWDYDSSSLLEKAITELSTPVPHLWLNEASKKLWNNADFLTEKDWIKLYRESPIIADYMHQVIQLGIAHEMGHTLFVPIAKLNQNKRLKAMKKAAKNNPDYKVGKEVIFHEGGVPAVTSGLARLLNITQDFIINNILYKIASKNSMSGISLLMSAVRKENIPQFIADVMPYPIGVSLTTWVDSTEFDASKNIYLIPIPQLIGKLNQILMALDGNNPKYVLDTIIANDKYLYTGKAGCEEHKKIDAIVKENANFFFESPQMLKKLPLVSSLFGYMEFGSSSFHDSPNNILSIFLWYIQNLSLGITFSDIVEKYYRNAGKSGINNRKTVNKEIIWNFSIDVNKPVIDTVLTQNQELFQWYEDYQAKVDEISPELIDKMKKMVQNYNQFKEKNNIAVPKLEPPQLNGNNNQKISLVPPAYDFPDIPLRSPASNNPANSKFKSKDQEQAQDQEQRQDQGQDKKQKGKKQQSQGSSNKPDKSSKKQEGNGKDTSQDTSKENGQDTKQKIQQDAKALEEAREVLRELNKKLHANGEVNPIPKHTDAEINEALEEASAELKESDTDDNKDGEENKDKKGKGETDNKDSIRNPSDPLSMPDKATTVDILKKINLDAQSIDRVKDIAPIPQSWIKTHLRLKGKYSTRTAARTSMRARRVSSYARPSRRLAGSLPPNFITPGKERKNATPKWMLAYDVSGSVSRRDKMLYLGATKALFQSMGNEAIDWRILIGDTEISIAKSVASFSEFLKLFPLDISGGGTMLDIYISHLLSLPTSQAYDGLVLFTDGGDTLTRELIKKASKRFIIEIASTRSDSSIEDHELDHYWIWNPLSQEL